MYVLLAKSFVADAVAILRTLTSPCRERRGARSHSRAPFYMQLPTIDISRTFGSMYAMNNTFLLQSWYLL